MSIKNTVTEVITKVNDDNITGYAAQSCFYIILSIFPCLLVLMDMFGILQLSSDTLFYFFKEMFPEQLNGYVELIITDLGKNRYSTRTIITIILTLWSAGKSFMTIILALNTIYKSKHYRNWLITRLISTVYTLLFLMLIIITLVFFIFGNKLIELTVPVIPTIAAFMSSVLNNKHILFPCITILLFLFIYCFVPTRKSTFAKEFPGAILASAGWYIFSYFYSLYVNNSSNFSYMYGSLTTLIFALMWLYTCLLIFFIGAELNAFIANGILQDFFRQIKCNIKKRK